ncbi:MAG: imidazole glycerol phosphate synthase subunit HisH [Sphaerochaeta sp.]
MKIAVVKYNAGNIRSVLCALKRLGYDATVTDDFAELASADRVIFPGVGEASTAMAYLKERGLDAFLKTLKQPFLGICLGMQLMCSFSEEHDTSCLGIFDVPVKKFVPTCGEKIPHMGWNTLQMEEDPLYTGLQDPVWCYFVHSYYVPVCSETIAKTEYAHIEFSASLRHDNFWGCQFHPEKSGDLGELILKNFLEAL